MKKPITRVLSAIDPVLAGRVEQRMRWRKTAWPMNGQTARLEMAREIMVGCAIARVVETGTYLGSTTEWLAGFGVPVTTVEIVPQSHGFARERLRRHANVDLRLGDSVGVLRALAAELIDRTQPTFFYLDAHWYDYLPLAEELEIVAGAFPKAVVMIDDFQVPDDPDYGFDSYGPGKELTLAYVRAARLPAMSVFLPAVAGRHETGKQRGSVVLTWDKALAETLAGLPLLRRWTGA